MKTLSKADPRAPREAAKHAEGLGFHGLSIDPCATTRG
jgi:hypothetical protein